MKQHKNLNTKLNIPASNVTSKVSLIGLEGFNFSSRIVSKYSIFRKSGRLPALVFFRLFSTSVMNKITRNNLLESINKYFRLHLNLYFNAISQLKQIVSHFSQSQKLINYIQSKFKSPCLFLHNKGDGVLENKKIIGKSRHPLSPLRIPIHRDEAILKPGVGPTISKDIIFRFFQNNKQRLQNNRLSVFLDEKLMPIWSAKERENVIPTKVGIQSHVMVLDSLLSRNEVGGRYLDKTLLSYNSGRMRIIPFTRTLSSQEQRGVEDGERGFSDNSKKIPTEIIYRALGNNYQNLNYVKQAKTSQNLKDSINKTINESADLVFRKPVAQKADMVSENRDYIHKDKLISAKAEDNLIKNLYKEKTVDKIEINTIADKVYRIIEKRISIEKERRGWR